MSGEFAESVPQHIKELYPDPPKPEVVLSEKPPEWLRKVCNKHRPVASVFGSNDLICAGHDGKGYIPWTPDHLARMIQQKHNEALKKILNGDNAA